MGDNLTEDEKRRRAITAWWKRKGIRAFIANLRDRAEQEPPHD